MFNEQEELPRERLPTRRSIHREIEEALINKLFKIVEEIEVLPNGELNFKPYTDNVLIQLETFIEKKFKEKVFDPKQDKQIALFLEKIKIERERREFTLLFHR
ncbi:MAG: hypothetical protein ACTSXO_00440 [Candidatus Heimdallarchaeota archaeon]|nr:MAG: hypothetical protein DRP02_02965 [Candidatus Gerdarchaeota archaeon]RLI73275.1 MAG: hypothetical protein DRO91_03260 [Candidatus Heimdallarchaeota archaeon]